MDSKVVYHFTPEGNKRLELLSKLRRAGRRVIAIFGLFALTGLAGLSLTGAIDSGLHVWLGRGIGRNRTTFLEHNAVGAFGVALFCVGEIVLASLFALSVTALHSAKRNSLLRSGLAHKDLLPNEYEELWNWATYPRSAELNELGITADYSLLVTPHWAPIRKLCDPILAASGSKRLSREAKMTIANVIGTELDLMIFKKKEELASVLPR